MPPLESLTHPSTRTPTHPLKGVLTWPRKASFFRIGPPPPSLTARCGESLAVRGAMGDRLHVARPASQRVQPALPVARAGDQESPSPAAAGRSPGQPPSPAAPVGLLCASTRAARQPVWRAFGCVSRQDPSPHHRTPIHPASHHTIRIFHPHLFNGACRPPLILTIKRAFKSLPAPTRASLDHAADRLRGNSMHSGPQWASIWRSRFRGLAGVAIPRGRQPFWRPGCSFACFSSFRTFLQPPS